MIKSTTKALSLAGLIAGISLFQSCDKIKDAVKADVSLTMSDVTFEVPVIANAGAVAIGEQNVYVNVDSIIKANNSQLSSSNIKSVKLESCHLEMLNGDQANNFANLSSCKMTIKSSANTTAVTLAEVASNPDATAYSLDLPVNTTVDMKDYFNSSSYTYNLSADARRATTKPVSIKATLKYTLSVGL